MSLKLYYCKSCGNLIVKLVDSGIDPYCCGREMINLVPNTTDGDGEKHVPVISCPKDGLVKVQVGAIAHPMGEKHFIQLVILETDSGFYVRNLKPDCEPVAYFNVGSEKPKAAYEFCNLHGLWKANVGPELSVKFKSCCLTSKC